MDADAPGPAEDGKTWATAYRTLTAALAQVPSIDTFWVAEGTYTPGATAGDTFLLGADTALYGGFAGTETSVNQRSWTAHETVLSGDLGGGVFAQHVLTKGTGGLTVLDGFTIRDGAGGAADGGGIYQASGALSVVNCRFLANSANHGGGLFVAAGATSVVASCTFVTNTAATGGGAVRSLGTLAFSQVDFVGNVAGGFGGAIHDSAGAGTNRFVNCAFVANRCGDAGGFGGGGAINFADAGGDGRREIRHATFFANHSDFVAGAIRMRSGQLTIADSILWLNASDYSAQGEDEIWADGGLATLRYSNVNDAQVAGAVLFGAGVINADPRFASTTAPYDVHLKSKFGRWTGGGWAFERGHEPLHRRRRPGERLFAGAGRQWRAGQPGALRQHAGSLADHGGHHGRGADREVDSEPLNTRTTPRVDASFRVGENEGVLHHSG